MSDISAKKKVTLLVKMILVLVVVGLVTAIALWWVLPHDQIRAVITKELSNRLKQEVTMSDFSVGFRPGLEFVAYDMRIVDPLTSQEMLAARRVWFDLTLRELFKLRCVVEDITFDSAVLNLMRDTRGVWNVEKVIESVLSTKKTDATHPVSWLEFGQISINDSSIGVDDKLTGQQLSVKGLTAIVDVREGSLAINSASVVSPFIEAELSGTISQFVQLNPVFDIRAMLYITKEGPFAKILPGTIPSGAKIAEVSLDASGHSTEIALDTTFSLNPLITAETSKKGTMAGTLRVKEGSFEVDDLNLSFGESTLSLSRIYYF